MRLRQALEAENSREGGFGHGGRKRPRLNPFKAKDKMYAFQDVEDDDDETLDEMPLMQRLQSRLMRMKQEDGTVVKLEDGTIIKNEGGNEIKSEIDGMIKTENGGFWFKQEDTLDEQSAQRQVKSERKDPLGKSPAQRRDSLFVTEDPVKTDDKSQDCAPFTVQHIYTPYSEPINCGSTSKFENTATPQNQYTHPRSLESANVEAGGYGGMSYPSTNTSTLGYQPTAPSNHSPFPSFNSFSFRNYDHGTASNAFAQKLNNNTVKQDGQNDHHTGVPFFKSHMPVTPHTSSYAYPAELNSSFGRNNVGDHARTPSSNHYGSHNGTLPGDCTNIYGGNQLNLVSTASSTPPFRLDVLNDALLSSPVQMSETKSPEMGHSNGIVGGSAIGPAETSRDPRLPSPNPFQPRSDGGFN